MAITSLTAEDLISFEGGIKAEWEAGELPCLLHLAGGNEDHLIAIFARIRKGDWILSTHRNHMHALLSGIPTDELRESIRHGHSMFTYSRDHNFLCSAVLAGTCGIAAGLAFAIKDAGDRGRVWCFIGDGGVEQGHFWEAINFVEGHALPCTFIVEDNDRSVDTCNDDRRGCSDALDTAMAQYKCIVKYHYKPTWPHAGSGCKFKIEFKADAIERMRPK